MNELSDLEHGPEEVSGFYNCSINRLRSLRGAPKETKDFYCYKNKLVSLKGALEK